MEDVINFSNNLKLLYVEDNKIAREATLMIFDEFFEKIIIAENGVEGLEKFNQNSDIDIIITDINMPKMNGLIMIEEIRKLNKSIPILILSAYNDIDIDKLEIDDYLLKPIDLQKFIEAIKKLMKRF